MSSLMPYIGFWCVPFLALLLDRLLGEPKRFHPLVLFGNLAKFTEKHLYEKTNTAGLFALIMLIFPIGLLILSLQAIAAGYSPIYAYLIDLIVLTIGIGWGSLRDHARPVAKALKAGDLPEARHRVSMLVSRDVSKGTEATVSRACVESVLENGSDAVFAPMFWCFLLGAPGVYVYRATNTLDAMWGYRNERYEKFGWAAARFDDFLNWVPARLTSWSYALFGNTKQALKCWREQAKQWSSPNAGPTMAAGAGALGVSLGGKARYHGKVVTRPLLGVGDAPKPFDIYRAITLIDKTAFLWAFVIAVFAYILHR